MNSTKLFREVLSQKPKAALIYNHFRCYQSASQFKILENQKTLDLSFFFKPHEKEKPAISEEKTLIIKCKNPKLDHYSDVSYTPQNVPLASSNWFFNDSVGDYFSILPSKLNLSTETFASIGINENLVKQLEKLGLTFPTVTQARAIKELLKGQNILYLDEKGSGKTLGCVIAIIEKLLDLKKSSGDSKAFALILCSGKESSIYLSETINKLVSDLGLKCNMICSDDKLPTEPNADILTTTFNELGNIQEFLLKDNLKFLVIDNSQCLYKTRSNYKILGDTIAKSLSKCNNSGSSADPNSLQLCWLSSLLSKNVDEMIFGVNKGIDLIPVHSSTFNKICRHVRQDFHRINEEDKMTELFKILTENEEKKIPTLVFGLPTKMDGKNTFDFIKEKKFTCVSMVEKKFYFKKSIECGFAPLKEDGSLGTPSILFPEAQHVINMDFGKYVNTYISKVHTLTRKDVEGSGRITNLIWNPVAVPNVQRLERLVRCNENIPKSFLADIMY